jgi:hypothetical protein
VSRRGEWGVDGGSGPLDFVGECDAEANRRKSQGRGKPCPYHDTAWQARPCHGRGAPCGYPSTQLHFLYLSPTKSFMVARFASNALPGMVFERRREGRRATIKAHPATPNRPRPYGKGFSPARMKSPGATYIDKKNIASIQYWYCMKLEIQQLLA